MLSIRVELSSSVTYTQQICKKSFMLGRFVFYTRVIDVLKHIKKPTISGLERLLHIYIIRSLMFLRLHCWKVFLHSLRTRTAIAIAKAFFFSSLKAFTTP